MDTISEKNAYESMLGNNNRASFCFDTLVEKLSGARCSVTYSPG